MAATLKDRDPLEPPGIRAADDNTERPPSAQHYQTPAECARTPTTAIARPGSREIKALRVGRWLTLRRSG